jgi:hypothetical protein
MLHWLVRPGLWSRGLGSTPITLRCTQFRLIIPDRRGEYFEDGVDIGVYGIPVRRSRFYAFWFILFRGEAQNGFKCSSFAFGYGGGYRGARPAVIRGGFAC